MQRILGSHVQYLQQVIYQDKLKNSQDVNRYFFNLPSTHARRNPYIFPSQETNPLKIVNLVDAAKSIGDTFVQHLFIEAGERLSCLLRLKADLRSCSRARTADRTRGGPTASCSFALHHHRSELVRGT